MKAGSEREKVIIALRKAKTSIEKILASVEREEPECFPAIQQNLAVIGLLKSVNMLMLEGHVDREIGKLGGSSPKRMQTLRNEIIRVIETSQNK